LGSTEYVVRSCQRPRAIPFKSQTTLPVPQGQLADQLLRSVHATAETVDEAELSLFHAPYGNVGVRAYGKRYPRKASGPARPDAFFSGLRVSSARNRLLW